MAITFDGTTKIISLSIGTTTLSVHDLYSRWKDWVLTSDNSKYALAFTSVGGDTIDPDAGTEVPLYAFLENGWKIRPQEANHTLNVVDGILLVNGGGDPFINTIGSYIVRINYQQPVQAIGFNTGGGGGGGATVDDILDEDLTYHTVPNSTADVLKKTKQIVETVEDNTDLIILKIDEIDANAGAGNDINIEVGHSNAQEISTIADNSPTTSVISIVTGTDSGSGSNILINTGIQSNSANIEVKNEGTDANINNKILVTTGVK